MRRRGVQRWRVRASPVVCHRRQHRRHRTAVPRPPSLRLLLKLRMVVLALVKAVLRERQKENARPRDRLSREGAAAALIQLLPQAQRLPLAVCLRRRHRWQKSPLFLLLLRKPRR